MKNILISILSIFIITSCGGGGSGSDNTPPSTSSLTKQEWRGLWKYIPKNETDDDSYLMITEDSIIDIPYSEYYECYEEPPQRDDIIIENESVYISYGPDHKQKLFVSIEEDIIYFKYKSGAIWASFEHSETPLLCSKNANKGELNIEIDFNNLPETFFVNTNTQLDVTITFDLDNSSSRSFGDLEFKAFLDTRKDYGTEYVSLSELKTSIYSCTIYRDENDCFYILFPEKPEVFVEKNKITVALDKSSHNAFNAIDKNTQVIIKSYYSYKYADEERTYYYSSDQFFYGYIPLYDLENISDPIGDYGGEVEHMDIINASINIIE